MDTWEHIKANSALTVADFWGHLTHQQGGTETFLTLSDGLEILMESQNYILEIEQGFIAEILTDFYISITEKSEYVVEIDY